jgi:nucleotide-binding universal stress UspA family protein
MLSGIQRRATMRVLVALDRTDTAAEAARALSGWAHEARPEIHVLHIVHPDAIPATPAPTGFVHSITPAGTVSGQSLAVREPLAHMAEDRTQAIARTEAEATDFLKDIAGQHLAGLDVTYHVEPGTNTADAIIAAAERLEADFVAMAARGRSGLGRTLFGSVHEDVVRRCRVPVLLVGPAARP